MLISLLIFLFVVVALLAIPLELEFKAAWPDDTENEYVLYWAFGLVRARIPTATEGSEEQVFASDLPAPKKRRKDKSPNVLEAFRQRRFRRRIYRFFRDLWRSIIKQDVRMRARVGLGDPAATGQLWAVVGPASGVLAHAREIEVVIEPDFVDTRFEIDSSGRFRLIPLHVIAIVVGLVASPAIWRGLRTMRA